MELKIKSSKNKEIIDITERINLETEKVSSAKAVLIFVKHTTAALTVGEVGEGTDLDFEEVMGKIIPKINFRHGHNPTHAPDHMIGSLLGPSLLLSVKDKSLDLGTWQRVVLLEENGPRELSLTLTFF